MQRPLGRLEPVILREVWGSESGDFTPWLANEDNLKLLGDTIGIELELEAQEQSVGHFRADIVCKDTSDGSWVLIENQLEVTDHTHLGQILTYAAGLDAVTLVWIAFRFTDEHKATIAWLNDIAAEKINFFALEIEVWQIGGSMPAPKFNVVAMPNEWTKGGGGVVKPGVTAGLTGTQQQQKEFWRVFREYVLTQHAPIKPTAPLPQHWMNISIGTSRAHTYAFMDTRENRIGVGLWLDDANRRAYFNLLASEKESIERTIGVPLAWNEKPERKSSSITAYMPGNNPKDKDAWEEQHHLLLDLLVKFRAVFGDRIKGMDANDWQPEPIPDELPAAVIAMP